MKLARFPDMKLYEEIIFLQNYFKGRWVVENVISYYEPLIQPQLIQRHYIWSNKIFPKIKQLL
jgi:DNA (cytosine-5)-methyltransferase 1